MKTTPLFGTRHVVFAAAALAVILVAGVGARAALDPIRYSAVASNLDPTVNVKLTAVDLTVTRWSTDAEREKLQSLLVERGQQKVLSALQDMPAVGTIKTPDSLSYDLHYARRIPGEDGGERVVLVTDRYISFWEAANMSRTMDYPFMIIELRLNAQGTGEGKLTVATKLSIDSRTKQVVLENYGDQPVRLGHVKRESH